MQTWSLVYLISLPSLCSLRRCLHCGLPRSGHAQRIRQLTCRHRPEPSHILVTKWLRIVQWPYLRGLNPSGVRLRHGRGAPLGGVVVFFGRHFGCRVVDEDFLSLWTEVFSAWWWARNNICRPLNITHWWPVHRLAYIPKEHTRLDCISLTPFKSINSFAWCTRAKCYAPLEVFRRKKNQRMR